MIALDTNILVHARRKELEHHLRAKRLLRELAEGEEPWGIPWPCIYEFLRIITHAKIFTPPTKLEKALEDLESLLQSPSLSLLGEGPAHFGHLRRTLRAGGTMGNMVHDGHIAAIAIEHGVSELFTLDRDFARFAELRTRNPFERS